MLNYFNLKNRVVSGIIYIIIIIYSIYKQDNLFHLIMMILSIICFLEFLILSKINQNIIQWNILFFMISLSFEYYSRMNNKDVISSLIIFPIACVIKNLFLNKEPLLILNQSYKILFGWLYISIPFFLARYIYTFSKGHNIIMGVFIILWIHDSFSFLIGKKWGKKKLVSFSNKTIEGFLGGMFFSLIFGIIFGLFYKNYIWLFISFIIAIFGTIGDIFESLIKRAYHVKDSSNLFPGHGGFLDRLDSFLFTIPIITGIFF